MPWSVPLSRDGSEAVLPPNKGPGMKDQQARCFRGAPESPTSPGCPGDRQGLIRPPHLAYALGAVMGARALAGAGETQAQTPVPARTISPFLAVTPPYYPRSPCWGPQSHPGSCFLSTCSLQVGRPQRAFPQHLPGPLPGRHRHTQAALLASDWVWRQRRGWASTPLRNRGVRRGLAPQPRAQTLSSAPTHNSHGFFFFLRLLICANHCF